MSTHGRPRIPRDAERHFGNRVGTTPLLHAAKLADAPMMRYLLANGGDPTITAPNGSTLLMWAAGIGIWIVGESAGTNEEALAAVKVALEQPGVDVNATNKDKDTALHGAAYRGANAIVQLLFEKGADLNAKNNNGWTPLVIAEGVFYPNTYNRRPETAELLQSLGAAPSPPDVQRRVPCEGLRTLKGSISPMKSIHAPRRLTLWLPVIIMAGPIIGGVAHHSPGAPGDSGCAESSRAASGKCRRPCPRRGDAAHAAAAGGRQVRGHRRPADESGPHGGRRDLAERSRQRQPLLGPQRRHGRPRGHAGLGRERTSARTACRTSIAAVRPAAAVDAESWEISFTSGGKTFTLQSARPAAGAASTPPAGLEFELVWVGSGTAADFVGPRREGQGGADSGHPAAGRPPPLGQLDGAVARAFEKGAAAVGVIFGISDNFAIWQRDRRPARLQLGFEDGKMLRDLLGEGQPVKVKLPDGQRDAPGSEDGERRGRRCPARPTRTSPSSRTWTATSRRRSTTGRGWR